MKISVENLGVLKQAEFERLSRQFPGVRFTGLAVVFHGWEMTYCDAVA